AQKANKKKRKGWKKGRIEKEEKLTQQKCDFGLWQKSKDMEAILPHLSNKDKLLALKEQLNFRKIVPKQKSDCKTTFSLTCKVGSNYVPHTIPKLEKKLITFFSVSSIKGGA
ncbi:unnamed protein product, partial [Owenia fusiformis]